MKRIVCIAIWALAFLSAGFLFAARAGKPRSENAPSPETEQPAAENAQESESSAPSQEGVQEEAAPKAEPVKAAPATQSPPAAKAEPAKNAVKEAAKP